MNSIADNLPVATRLEFYPNRDVGTDEEQKKYTIKDIQFEHGYRLGFSDNSKVGGFFYSFHSIVILFNQCVQWTRSRFHEIVNSYSSVRTHKRSFLHVMREGTNSSNKAWPVVFEVVIILCSVLPLDLFFRVFTVLFAQPSVLHPVLSQRKGRGRKRAHIPRRALWGGATERQARR